MAEQGPADGWRGIVSRMIQKHSIQTSGKEGKSTSFATRPGEVTDKPNGCTAIGREGAGASASGGRGRADRSPVGGMQAGFAGAEDFAVSLALACSMAALIS